MEPAVLDRPLDRPLDHGERSARQTALEAEVAEVCGILNSQHGRLVALVEEVLTLDAWAGPGLHTIEHWLTWHTGMTPHWARKVCDLARRAAQIPTTVGALAAGEVSIDQATVVARKAPPDHEREACELALSATVYQLSRALGHYLAVTPAPPAIEAEQLPRTLTDQPDMARAEGHWDDHGWYHLTATMRGDDGQLVDDALRHARELLVNDGRRDVTWLDALREVHRRSLDADDVPERRDRTRTYLHVDVTAPLPPRLTNGMALPSTVVDYLTCDSAIIPVWERDHVPIGMGRTTRTVPAHLRRMVMRRDGHRCRVPGCGHTRFLEVHHIEHWNASGPTETWNLVALCSADHRAHHAGKLHVSGNADHADGLVFTNELGTPISGPPPPTPPRGPAPRPSSTYRHPVGERMQMANLWFRPPALEPSTPSPPRPPPDPPPE